MATLLSLFSARRSGEASSLSPQCLVLLGDRDRLPIGLSRAMIAIGTGVLFCTIRPVWMR